MFFRRSSWCAGCVRNRHAEAVVRQRGAAQTFRAPDADDEAEFAARQAAHPEWMSYFHLNHNDYVILKVGPIS